MESREYFRLRQAERNKRLHAGGLCIKCGENLGEEKTLRCGTCASSIKDARKETVAELRAKGLCGRCSRPSGKFFSCPQCRSAANSRRRKKYVDRKATGICTTCGKPKELNRAAFSRCGSCQHNKYLSGRAGWNQWTASKRNRDE